MRYSVLPYAFKRGTLLALVLTLAGGLAAAQRADDWNQWRGPNRDGRIPNYRPPERWPAQLRQAWKVEVGLGHASPVVVGQALYLFSRAGEEEVVRRLDLATGKEAWRERYPAPYQMHEAAVPHGPGPKATPTYAEGRLYTFGISGILSCLDAATGKARWRHDFKGQYPKTSPLYGVSASPLVDRERVIVPVGTDDNGALAAFDAATGEARWRWTGDGPGYSSPIIIEIDGVRQVVTQSQRQCVGVAAADGALLWSVPFTTPFAQNIFTPVVAGDRLIFGGTRQPTFALRVRRERGAWKTEKVWETREATFYMNTPVFLDGRLFGFSERQSGQLTTLDAATGKLLWSGEARLSTNAQVLEGGGMSFVLTTEADLIVFKRAGDALAQVARYDVAESPTWATPAVVGNRILIKDLNHLICWQVP